MKFQRNVWFKFLKICVLSFFHQSKCRNKIYKENSTSGICFRDGVGYPIKQGRGVNFSQAHLNYQFGILHAVKNWRYKNSHANSICHFREKIGIFKNQFGLYWGVEKAMNLGKIVHLSVKWCMNAIVIKFGTFRVLSESSLRYHRNQHCKEFHDFIILQNL